MHARISALAVALVLAVAGWANAQVTTTGTIQVVVQDAQGSLGGHGAARRMGCCVGDGRVRVCVQTSRHPPGLSLCGVPMSARHGVCLSRITGSGSGQAPGGD